MNVTTLLKVLALVSANKYQHGGLTNLPVHFTPESVAHPKASLTIDLNKRGPLVENGDVSNGNNTFNATAPFNSTESGHDLDRDPRENEVNTHPNEVTALEVWHDPNGVVYKPYFASDDANDAREAKEAKEARSAKEARGSEEAKQTVGTKVKYHMGPREVLANVVERFECHVTNKFHSNNYHFFPVWRNNCFRDVTASTRVLVNTWTTTTKSKWNSLTHSHAYT